MTILALGSVAITCCALAVFKTLSYEDQISKTEKEIFTANEKIINFTENNYNKITNAKIVGGYNFFVTLAEDGKVYGWGQNNYG